MSQARQPTDVYQSIPMPRLATSSLTPEQRDQALQRMQDQTDKRTRLGFELFRATEAQTTRQQAAIDLLQTQHNELSTRLEVEINNLRKRVEQQETTFEKRLSETAKDLCRKVDAIQQNWSAVERRMTELVNRITHMAEGANRQFLRPTPRPVEAPSSASETEVLLADIPMTAASMPGPIDERLRTDSPLPQPSRPATPAQPMVKENYDQALQRLRSERARPADI